MIRRLYQVVGIQHARPIRIQLAALACYAALQGLAFVVMVPVLRNLVNGDVSAAWPWIGVLAALVAVTVTVHYLQAVQGYRVALDTSRRLYHRIGDHVATLPLGWFSGAQAGQLNQLASKGVTDVRMVFAHLLQPLVAAVVIPIVATVAMFFFDWRLGLAVLLACGPIYLAYKWSGRQMERADHDMHEASAEANDRIIEFARLQPVLRAFSGSGQSAALLDEALRAQNAAGHRQLRGSAPARAAFRTALQLLVAGSVLLAAVLITNASVDVAETIALLVLVVRIAEPLAEVGELGGLVRVSRNSLNRISALLETPQLPIPDVPAAAGATGDIVFDQVSFSYDRDTPVIDSVSFEVPAGTMTALVGASGSGKTTLTRLLARFWDVDSGRVLLGGVDVRTMDSETLMSQLAVVFQDVYLFDSTVRDNIRAGQPEATDQQVLEAARLARVDEITARLPDGLDSRVGEGGTSLSGGERQRVSLARALIKDAPVVLLDEATAALDPQNEAAVGRVLAAMAGRRTLLVIAHRLQTVLAADQIIVLDRGRVVEKGTHNELRALGGRYATFWRERTRARRWRLARGYGAASAGNEDEE